MVFSEKPHTIILKATNSDAKLKYFDTNNYFKK